MEHLSIQYGASLITVSESLITVRDVYPYSMGHIPMQYGTYMYTINMAYGTYI